jgi:hypothetical protein
VLEKQSKTNKHYYYIIIALNHYSFYFFLSKHTKLKQNKLKDIQSKIQENINQCRNWARNRTKKIANFTHISALLSSAGLHLSVFSSKIR